MKKYIVLFVLVTIPSIVSADPVKIDDLWYNLISKSKTAEVYGSSLIGYKGDIVIPETVKFEDVEYTVTSISPMAFMFSQLTSITIPSSITTIGAEAFSSSYTENFSAIYITDIAAWCNIDFESRGPSSEESNPLSYAHNLYLNGKQVVDLVIPEGVTTIKPYAFCGATFSSISFPSSLTFIGRGAFETTGTNTIHISDLSAWCNATIESEFSSSHDLYLNGDKIESLIIPSVITNVGANTFYGCSGLKCVEIPDGVTSIGENAFRCCSGITILSIPNSVKTIEDGAFMGCGGLTSITIPDGLGRIQTNLLYGCTSLTSIIIPNSVTSIEKNAFYECSHLTSVTIGDGVTYIDGGAFASCTELTDVYCYVEEVTNTRGGKGLYTDRAAFYNSYPEYITLHVPEKAIEAYKATEPWSEFKEILPLESTKINAVSVDSDDKSVYYNLNGQIVDNPQKGIYIHNNKKIIIK